MNAGWIIPFIILGGALQSCGAAMNGQLNKRMNTAENSEPHYSSSEIAA